MALKKSESTKIAEDLGSGSSESSDEAAANIAVCKICPLTAAEGNKKKWKPRIDESNDNDFGDDDDDDDDDADELVIDETKTSADVGDQEETKKEKAEYKRQVSTPLKKRKVLPAEDEPMTITAGAQGDEMEDPTTFGLPSGWTRKITERMSGASAGKLDVYITSPEGKRCRSMKEVTEHLEKTKSSYTIADFIFKPKNLKSQATPATIRPPANTSVKAAKTPPAKKPVKRSNTAEGKESSKKSKSEENAEKEKSVKERKRRSPTKSATLLKKKSKEPRQVRKPPPEKASVKASKREKFQKLLVKINFQQRGTEESDLESEEVEEDSFDEGSEPAVEEEEGVEVPKSPPKRSPRGVKNSQSE